MTSAVRTAAWRFSGMSSARLLWQSRSATRLVDRLQKADLAERHPDPRDLRKMLVTLTRDRTPEIGAAWDTPGKPSTRRWTTSPTTSSS
ncbi:hypothetical protein [Streptomyces sp. NPDC008141]|uniref:hypothetical protein n=1 Tax=Streptomyces sp. NPDC008141 TaxID=3364815 RepID=UPI0036E85925